MGVIDNCSHGGQTPDRQSLNPIFKSVEWTKKKRKQEQFFFFVLKSVRFLFALGKETQPQTLCKESKEEVTLTEGRRAQVTKQNNK